MANRKEYAYYLKGNRIAIVQRDYNLTDGLNYVYDPSKGLELGSGAGEWKSPTESIADGLEIEYAYSPKYVIETTNDVAQNLTQYQSVDGKLTIADNTSAYTNYATSYALSAGDYIVLRKAGKFNGLHKISSIGNGPAGTNNKIILTTKYSGSESAWTDFEETPDLYYVVNVLEDESDEIPVSEYLSKAIIDYVKSKLSEDRGEIEVKEYFMKEFYKKIEKHQNAKISGKRSILSGINAIK